MNDKILYGCAYYDEYMPEERLEKDMELMKQANINVIRIAESTWATEEPTEGVFDFTHVERALNAAQKAGIAVIVGTPTYAVPPWLAAKHPEVIAVTKNGQGKYGARQNMDITAPAYLFYAERLIRGLMKCVQKYSCVIGFQLDNETKHYGTAGKNVQKKFAEYLRKKFITLDAMNKEFGFNYWSNRVDSWENLPDVTGTINWSYAAEFSKFQRSLVTKFLLWQSDIVKEYLKKGQFITHNFDYEWRGYSFGIQPNVNHKDASMAVTLSGCDIYHPTQNLLTGREIAFGGDVCRSLKRNPYLVLETQAQGHVNWAPYNGQLRLQAFSHMASGACGVMYWHWHSIHNSFETYWKGILSHDLLPNRIYREISTIGADFNRIGNHLLDLKKDNKTAILVSNESLTAMDLFKLPGEKINYNDIVRLIYNVLFDMNVECDILFPQDTDNFKHYELILMPAMYSAEEKTLVALNNYVKNGGTLLATFKSGFSNENLTVYNEAQPAKMTECFGITYDEFTEPVDVTMEGDKFELSKEDRKVTTWMELIRPTTATTIAHYGHKEWKSYSAVTTNNFGSGVAYYVAALTTEKYLRELLKLILKKLNLWNKEQEAELVIKKAVNRDSKNLHFYMNYSKNTVTAEFLHKNSTELISGDTVAEGAKITLPPWGFAVLEEN